MHCRLLLFTVLIGIGCGDGGGLLLVDLKTDLVAGREFDQVRVEVAGAESSAQELDVVVGDSFLTGRRVGELQLPGDPQTVFIDLVLAGQTRLTRRVRVEVDGQVAITVVMTRDCRGVQCGEPAASECLAGTCVSEQCTVEAPELCAPPECTADGDCSAPASCATARCVDGACLLDPNDAICAAGEVCDPDTGCAARSRGATPTVTSTIRISGRLSDMARAVVPDSAGGLYVVGYVNGPTVSFAFEGETSTVGRDAFVSRFDSSDQLLWARVFGGPFEGADGLVELASDVAVDVDGNAYVSGTVVGDADFGAGIELGDDSPDAFVASWTPDGTLRWVTRLLGNSAGHELGRDGAGSTYLVGSFRESLNVGSDVLNSVGSKDAFAARFDSLGAATWSWAAGSTSSDDGRALDVAPDGSVMIAAMTGGPIDFGGGPAGTPGGGALVSLAIDGSFVDERHLSAQREVIFEEVRPDASGNLYVVGTFEGELSVDDTVLSGGFGKDGFVLSLDPTGAVRWFQAFASSASDFGHGLDLDDDGNVYVVGEFERSADFGGGLIYANGGCDMFVASYDSAGQFRWVNAFGGPGYDDAWGVHSAPDGTLAVAGAFTGSVEGGVSFGDVSVSGGGGSTGVVVRMSP